MGTRLERRRDVAIIQTRNDSDPNSDEDERQGGPRGDVWREDGMILVLSKQEASLGWGEKRKERSLYFLFTRCRCIFAVLSLFFLYSISFPHSVSKSLEC